MRAGEVLFSYEPSLVEEVVFHELWRREERGDVRPMAEYHERVDPIYDMKLPARQREEAFAKVHAELFVRFGYEKVLREALATFPELAAIREVIVKRAISQAEEWADLSTDRQQLGLRIRAWRFEDEEQLRRFLWHEFRHVADLLDPAFGHPGKEQGWPVRLSPAEMARVQERYHLLWGIYVDGRLAREGKTPLLEPAAHYRRFAAMYGNVLPARLQAAFTALWQATALTHQELVEMALDPAKVVARGEGVAAAEKVLLLGSSCPLCRFPTFRWAEGLKQLPEEVLAALKADFPEWVPQDGACERCIEVYRARAEAW
ncbi:MAG: hypothetical protein KatS3mg131_1365 [Candidatus Tectimicrobiota bacterium]|nr:MAG: hypothetical protein KatS3mg131_1365 [Candidatus Tectomicrobia bacterium]